VKVLEKHVGDAQLECAAVVMQQAKLQETRNQVYERRLVIEMPQMPLAIVGEVAI